MTHADDLAARQRRLNDIRAGVFYRGEYPPEGWYRDLGLPETWSDAWATDLAPPQLGTYGPNADDDYPTVRALMDAWEAEREFRSELLHDARVIEKMRKDGRPVPEQLAPVDPPDVDTGRVRFDDRRAARVDGAAAWNRLQPLRARRKQLRILAVYCPHSSRDKLIEAYSQRSAKGRGGEQILIVAYRASHQPRAVMAAEPDDPTSETLPYSCPHGVGRFPLSYPDFIRRVGPPMRRRITDLERDITNVQWRAYQP